MVPLEFRSARRMFSEPSSDAQGMIGADEEVFRVFDGGQWMSRIFRGLMMGCCWIDG